MRRSAQRLQPCKWPLILRFVITGSASELASRTICGTSEKMVSTGVVVRIAFGQARPANPQGCAVDSVCVRTGSDGANPDPGPAALSSCHSGRGFSSGKRRHTENSCQDRSSTTAAPNCTRRPRTGRLDGKRLHIEKQQDASPRPVPPQLPESMKDTPAVSVLAPQLPGDAAERVHLFSAADEGALD